MACHILFVVVPDVELIAVNMSIPFSRVSAIRVISVDAYIDGGSAYSQLATLPSVWVGALSWIGYDC
jgi:hypothetical protein